VTRAIAIVTKKPYGEVYDGFFKRIKIFEATRKIAAAKKAANGGGRSGTTPGNEITKEIYHPYLTEELGMIWTPTMKIGQGCKVHVRENDLPKGTLIVRVSHHLSAVIDRVINDLWDCSDKCVYGYYSFPLIEQIFELESTVFYKGKKTQVISFIPHLNKYLLAGIGDHVSPKDISFKLKNK